MPILFSPLQLRSLTLPNRIIVSPMCQYSCEDGMPNEWHFVHLGSRAVGGASLVFVEASGVTPEGRITPWDAGIWSEAHGRAWKPVADFIRAQGAVPGIQLAHAGRKASCNKPWLGGKALGASEGAWETLGPSAIAFGHYPPPRAMTVEEIGQAVEDFRRAARYSLDAGFDVVEIHGAHGYLLAQFLSPISNQRNDRYGGDRAGRMRFPLAAAKAVRENWPESKPMFIRVSAVDGGGGWDVDDTVAYAKELKALGIDVIDTSSGGLTGLSTALPVKRSLGFQVPFAGAVKRGANIPTMAVGLILDGPQAEAILQSGDADLIAIGRQALYDPFWAVHAAQELGCDSDFEMWTPEYGWWLDKRKNNLAGLKK